MKKFAVCSLQFAVGVLVATSAPLPLFAAIYEAKSARELLVLEGDQTGHAIKVANCTEEPQAICVEGVKGQAVKTLFGGGEAMDHNSPAEVEALKESVGDFTLAGSDTLPPLSLVIYRTK